MELRFFLSSTSFSLTWHESFNKIACFS